MTSEHGQGTSAQIRLPLTLAIMAALLVEADGRPFAIPLDRIERTVRAGRPRRPLGRRPPDARALRDGVLPIVDAAERYGGAATPDAEYAVIVRGGGDAPRARRQPRSSASASWSPARCRPRSPRAPPCRAPPCCRTGRSP